MARKTKPAPVAPVLNLPVLVGPANPFEGNPTDAQLHGMGLAARNLRVAQDALTALLREGAGATIAMRDRFMGVYIGARLMPNGDYADQLEFGGNVRRMAGVNALEPNEFGQRTKAQEDAYNAAKTAWNAGLTRAGLKAVDTRGGHNRNQKKDKPAPKADTPAPAPKADKPAPAPQEEPRDVTPTATTAKQLGQLIRAEAQRMAALLSKNAPMARHAECKALTDAAQAFIDAVKAATK